MENTLLDLILLSEKRKNVLLLLLEGPKDIETIKKALNASATAVQPQVKKLKEQHLVVQEKNLYKLSEIGRIVAEKMKPLVDTLSVLEENTDYWADTGDERDSTFSPAKNQRAWALHYNRTSDRPYV